MYLLDTHAFFWFITDDEKLPENVKDIIETNENIYVSIVTFWEMAIKIILERWNSRYPYQI